MTTNGQLEKRICQRVVLSDLMHGNSIVLRIGTPSSSSQLVKLIACPFFESWRTINADDDADSLERRRPAASAAAREKRRDFEIQKTV